MQSTQNFCVSIPEELKQYGNFKEKEINQAANRAELKSCVEFVTNSKGQVECSKFYDSAGDLVKILYYSGPFVVKKCRYKNNKLNAVEEYDEKHILTKTYYNSSGDYECSLEYHYNRTGQTTSIVKYINKCEYRINYGYDDIMRINTREILFNGEVMEFQRFKYDILDRITEYQDKNQKIIVDRYSETKELISYTITDKINNEISITNLFDSKNKYIKTKISLNGHEMLVSDTSYVDNIMLKKPYTTEDDIDLIISNLFGAKECAVTKRTSQNDVSSTKIELSIKSTTLPISIRKRLLYQAATKS